MPELVILFIGLMSHVAGDGDRVAVLINAPDHAPELRVAQSAVRTAIPPELGATIVGDEYVVSLRGYRVTSNVGFGSPALDSSAKVSVPALTTVSSCRVLRAEIADRRSHPDVSSYVVYRGGTLSVASYETFQGKFDAWPEERCMPRTLQYKIPATNVELIFTRLADSATWTFGLHDGAQVTVSNSGMGLGHFHHQYKVFSDCTGPSPATGAGCSRAAILPVRTSRIGAQNYTVECSPTQYP